MKLYNMKLNNILLEATPDEIYQKYYSSFDKNIFDTIVKADPKTYTDENGNIKKIGAFSKLLLKLYNKNPRFIEDLENATQYLDIVYKKRVPIDINKINDLADIYEKIKIYFTKSNLTLNNVLDLLTINVDYKLLFKNNEWSLFEPLNEKGSCYLGFNTEWCTAWGKYSLNDEHKSKTNHFIDYAKNEKDGTNESIFIIINNINNDEKYQIHLSTNSFNLSNDKNLTYSQRIDVFKKLPKELKYKIFPYINPNIKIQLDDPISKIKLFNNFLPNEDKEFFIKKYLLNVDYENTKNTELIDAINNKNENITEIFKNYFNDIYNVFFINNNLQFNVSSKDIDYTTLKKHFNFINKIKKVGKEFDFTDYGSEVDLKNYLSNFYENYKDDINSIMEVNNFQEFYKISEPFRFNKFVIDRYRKKMYEINIKKHIVNLINQYDIPNLKLTKSSNSYQITVDSSLLKGILAKYDIEYFRDRIVQVVSQIIRFFAYNYNFDIHEDLLENMFSNTPPFDFLNNTFEDILYDLEDEYINDAEQNGGCKVNAIKKINQIFSENLYFDNEYYSIDKPNTTEIYCRNNIAYINVAIYDKKNNKYIKDDIMVDNITNYTHPPQLQLKESLLKNFKRFI